MAPPGKKEDKRVVLNPKDFTSNDAILGMLNKQLGGGIASTGCDVDESSTRGATIWSTGILSLDKYIGTGGLVGGRIVNAWGWEGTGKTLMGMVIGASVQRQGGRYAHLDAEGTFNPTMARAVGVDVDNLILIQSTPEKIMTGEDYFDAMRLLGQMGVEFILVDSIPALTPSSKLDARVGEGQKATSANMMSEGLPPVNTILQAHKRSVLYMINQMRAAPMVMFGPSAGHTGGNAIKFYETYGFEIKKREDIVRTVPTPTGQWEDKRIGVRCQLEAKKNKTAPIPVDPIQYVVYFETVTDKNGVTYHAGVDVIDDAVEVGIKCGVINKNSSWYDFGGVKANGLDAFKLAFRIANQEDPNLFASLRNHVLGYSSAPSQQG